jgi:hypothetical protein
VIHEAGYVRTFVTVGETYNANPYAIVGANNIPVTTGAETKGGGINSGGCFGGLADKFSAGFHTELIYG